MAAKAKQTAQELNRLGTLLRSGGDTQRQTAQQLSAGLAALRTAVSGKQMTPGGAYEIMEILGKEESLARIRKGIELLKAVQ